jgi:hypothetical protein
MMRGEPVEYETPYQGAKTTSSLISIDILEALQEEAARRGKSPLDLAREILAVVVKDKLYVAILVDRGFDADPMEKSDTAAEIASGHHSKLLI